MFQHILKAFASCLFFNYIFSSLDIRRSKRIKSNNIVESQALSLQSYLKLVNILWTETHYVPIDPSYLVVCISVQFISNKHSLTVWLKYLKFLCVIK